MSDLRSGDHPPICDYEGSDYQAAFWDKGHREYENRVEEIALRRLLPQSGKLLLELGAGAGRNTARYIGFERTVLLDYSLSQLRLAQERLGRSDRYVYVAGDIYRLPFANRQFDAATMIRTLHHLADPEKALVQIQRTLQPQAHFILEYANKRNLKAILRYLTGQQPWNPFSPDAVEFAHLNFDFHPSSIRRWLNAAGFTIQRQLTVSHFRVDFLKRVLPLELLVRLDSAAQWTGNLWQFTPSVFVRTLASGGPMEEPSGGFFRCPECSHSPLIDLEEELNCAACGRVWAVRDGIYDFREPIK
jgi:ubiquinone/menaquinone biosynthesis C-methylase UbiE